MIAEFDKSVDLKLFQDDFAKLPEVRKKAITLAGGRSFIGNVSINNGYHDRVHNDTLIVSPLNNTMFIHILQMK